MVKTVRELNVYYVIERRFGHEQRFGVHFQILLSRRHYYRAHRSAVLVNSDVHRRTSRYDALSGFNHLSPILQQVTSHFIPFKPVIISCVASWCSMGNTQLPPVNGVYMHSSLEYINY